MTEDLSETEHLRRELAMLADVRARIRDSIGPDARIPTGTVDNVLDDYNTARERERGDDPDTE
ncbi:hypothetical protein P9990_26585 (plasmid) [Prescottella equi]|uniref:hypothetical protein n=1 Tax=Rhodococcus hoagii TaxID=43767 RepID=UPI0025752460|nr:hypothetical protein [Prescottella equi]WJJ14645.1 hypothetical protein P9990_26585 [Prescottella equi]